ncbi:MAG: hypothetical protein HYV35_11240 [Lentisphaerae bacterium]|nr:hypothetical protein [Lentisphaerota bacterium]
MNRASLTAWLCVVVSSMAISALAEPPATLGASPQHLFSALDSDQPANYNLNALIQQAKLSATDGAAGDYLGVSVALDADGDTAIVGAYRANVAGDSDRGAAYVFTRSGTTWTEQEKLIVADGASYDYLGIAVALSSNGNTALVGAHGVNMPGKNDQGAAYVFTRSGTTWTQQEKLTAADGDANDEFGSAVALSGDGDTALIGASQADVSGDNDQGAAYVFTRSGSTWTQQQKLTVVDGAAYDYLGTSVALNSDGNTAIAGASHADVGGNYDRGAAYVFARSGSTWTEQEKLIASDGASSDELGNAVALSGDGNTAIAGAHQANAGGDDQGAAYVFTRSGTDWTQQQKLTAADGAMNDYLGHSVSLSSDGNMAIAGAYQADVGVITNQGAAYAFTRSGATWTQQQKLTAADGATYDEFGQSVALSGDGYTTLVGVHQANTDGDSDRGTAYVFAEPPPPAGIAASYDYYVDRVRVTWDAAHSAAGYEVWRGASDDTNQATRIATGISGTEYDDTTATVGTNYYFWVRTTNSNGTSVFSSSALGRVLLGPDVRLNGEAGPLTISSGSALAVTVSLNPSTSAGTPQDWWVAALASSDLYFLNSSMAWTTTSAPAYQGGLLAVQSFEVLNISTLPAGTYTFYFGIDTLNGVIDPDITYDSATVTVAP